MWVGDARSVLARRMQPEAGVPIDGVVPWEEDAAVCAGILNRAEAVGIVWPVLERLEVRLGIRIVVRNVRPRMRLRDAQIRQQQRDRLGGHGRAAVRVDREVPARGPWRRQHVPRSCVASAADSFRATM